MGEVPLVIVDVQRLGPSTGGATTVAQGDVQFVRWGTSGGYPIIALAPGNVVECFTLTARAFELAERFRCPVFLLTDKEVVMTLTTVDVAAYPQLRAAERVLATSGAPYRYEPADEVSPASASTEATSRSRFTGSTHDERAFITKHAPTIGALNHHLAAKIEDHLDEIELVDADLEPGAKTLVVGYGVTAGRSGRPWRRPVAPACRVVTRCAELVAGAGASTDRGAGRGRTVIVPELNLGQYRREVERVAAGRRVIGINRIDGELIAPEPSWRAIS